MTKEYDSENQYYFVPLGRERGGYLDLLGLPPTATIMEAKKAEVQYKKSIEKDFKTKRKGLRSKLKDKDITQEEFDAQVKEWEEEKTQKKVELNKLNENFKKAQSEKRKLKNKRIKDTDVVWFEMYSKLNSEDYFSEWLSARKPIRTMDQTQLDALKSSLFQSELRKKQKLANITPHGEGEKQLHLSDFSSMIDERKIVCMLWADTIWSKLQHTNRKFWINKVKEWKDELDLSLPQFNVSADRDSLNSLPLFSSLCSMSDLTIDRLSRGEVEDYSQMPERKGDQEQFDFKKLLAAAFEETLRKEADSKSEEKMQSSGNQPSEDKFLDMFLDLLKAAGLADNDQI